MMTDANEFVAPTGAFRRNANAALLAALILLITASAFLEDFSSGQLARALLTSLVYLLALAAISARRRTFALALSLIIPAIVTKWLDHFRPGLLPHWLYLAIGLTCMAYITIALLRFILHAPRVDSEVIFAGVSGYLMMAILWATAYMVVARVVPDAFAFNAQGAAKEMDAFTAVYFSFGVLGTVGFGDIVPVMRTARLLAVFEATAGMFYMTIVIARVVGLYVPASRRAPGQ